MDIISEGKIIERQIKCGSSEAETSVGEEPEFEGNSEVGRENQILSDYNVKKATPRGGTPPFFAESGILEECSAD